MELHTFPKVINRRKKRLGQGWGSGKGKTGGRGTKGQKARETVRMGFEGGQLRLIKRLPFLRGKLRNKPKREKAPTLSLSRLNTVPKNSQVTLEFLKTHGFIDESASTVKILSGTLDKPLTVAVPVSKQAKAEIEKMGGKVAFTS